MVIDAARTGATDDDTRQILESGQLKSYTTNLFRLTGSAFTILTVLLWNGSSLLTYIIAINGSPLLGSILNSIYASQSVLPSFRSSLAKARTLLPWMASGVSFLVIGLGSFGYTNFLQIGFHREKIVAIVSSIEVVTISITGLIASHFIGVQGMQLAMVIVMALGSVWLYPYCTKELDFWRRATGNSGANG